MRTIVRYASELGVEFNTAELAAKDDERLPRIIETYRHDLQRMESGLETFGKSPVTEELKEHWRVAIKEYELLWEKAQANKPKGTQAKIELLYNGDYPGYPCVRVNDKWLTAEQASLLCKLFDTANLVELYDKVGLSKNWDGVPSEEHKPLTGVIAISQ
jgi:hypothetical protein